MKVAVSMRRFQLLDALSSMNEGTLGKGFVKFYQRNGMHLPSRSQSIQGIMFVMT